MKPHYLLLLSLLIACQKPKPAPQIANTASVNKTETTAPAKEKFLKTDTISIVEDGETTANNYILAHLVDQKMNKDSIVTGNYLLDLYQNKTKTASTKITIKGTEEGSEWSASYGLTPATAKNSLFLKISFGYPACGYTRNSYLFYLKNSDLQLVHEWYSMSDSGWGTWVEFENPAGKANPESFYCKTVSFEPEDDNENMGTVSHSDSIVFRLSGNHWKKQFLSVKDKNYFEKKMSFDEFHNQK